MKRIGIVCWSVLTLALFAASMLAQQPPATTSPVPSASAASPEVPKVVTERLNQLDQKVAVRDRSKKQANL